MANYMIYIFSPFNFHLGILYMIWNVPSLNPTKPYFTDAYPRLHYSYKARWLFMDEFHDSFRYNFSNNLLLYHWNDALCMVRLWYIYILATLKKQVYFSCNMQNAMFPMFSKFLVLASQIMGYICFDTFQSLQITNVVFLIRMHQFFLKVSIYFLLGDNLLR